ncbi:MAG: hypothetical protein DSM106950_10210 [Stigonema ocellatum SAG 48.90 = DSM 106950]|nr:hypothetical protein [Stigonema ocellatum SAG 48.90 = DSM 106950]
MTKPLKLSFIAQSLDNKNDDLIFYNGEKVSNGSEQVRKVFDSIALIMDGNKPFFQDTKLKLYLKFKEQIVIQIIPLDRDIAHRLSPIIIHGYLPADESANINEWSFAIKKEVEDIIINKAERKIEPEILEQVQKQLVQLYQDNQKKSLIQKEGLLFISSTCGFSLILIIIQCINLPEYLNLLNLNLDKINLLSLNLKETLKETLRLILVKQTLTIIVVLVINNLLIFLLKTSILKNIVWRLKMMKNKSYEK